MIRDKRKISLGGTAGKAPESKEANGSEAKTSEPAAKDTPAEAVKADAKAPPTGEPEPAKPEAGKPAEQEPEAIVPPEAAEPEGEAKTDSAELGELRTVLDERTADLQRVTAEYANYRKRVERDRTQAAELAVGMVLTALLPVLDDIDRARDHGDLNGPFASVAEQLTTVTTKFGLTAFGAKGDSFDPNRHEAVAHLTSSEVTEPTCIDVMRRGYLLGERLLRPAMVAVADPESE
ncbi:MAG TPA: nucleotide exchange factor GrpE [Candidatus Limnocylindrales bacterium]